MGFKRKSFFGDEWFVDFDRLHDLVEKMMDESVKDFHTESTGFETPGKPLVYGFSYKRGANGKPVVSEFGNLQAVKKRRGLNEWEPLVDVIDGSSEVRVVAELPGVEEKEIKLNAKGNVLSIRVDNPEKRYAKDVALPSKVSKHFSASFKNGILEVVLRKA